MVKTFPFLDVDIVLTYPDDTTDTFRLQAPNAEDPFRWGFRRINILPPYRDGNYELQKGFEKYQFTARLSYNWHQMEPWKLLAAQTIELKIPPVFNEFSSNYHSYTVFIENEEVLKNWLKGLVMNDELNSVPSGNLDLEFAGVTPFSESEMLGKDFFQVPPYPPGAGALYKIKTSITQIGGFGFPVKKLASVLASAALQVPSGATVRFIAVSAQAHVASKEWSTGGATYEFLFQLFGNDLTFFTDTAPIEQSDTNCQNPSLNQYALAEPTAVFEVPAIGSGSDPSFVMTEQNRPTSTTVCVTFHAACVFYVRVLGVSSSQIIPHLDAFPGIDTIELIFDFG